jgi:hypothetical protein
LARLRSLYVLAGSGAGSSCWANPEAEYQHDALECPGWFANDTHLRAERQNAQRSFPINLIIFQNYIQKQAPSEYKMGLVDF